jgi:hypothetical protein
LKETITSKDLQIEKCLSEINVLTSALAVQGAQTGSDKDQKSLLLYDLAKSKEENHQLAKEIALKMEKIKRIESQMEALVQANEELKFIREANNQELIACEKKVNYGL